MPGETVLIVEDNAMNLELARDLLLARGYLVLCAETAEEGLALARAEHPDLILMDIALPGMDGITAVQMLRDADDTATIPIVALTAHAMKGDEETARQAGCDGYITKPIDTRQFTQQIDSYMRGDADVG